MEIVETNFGITELNNKILAIKKQLQEKIMSLPENPNITRVAKNCFTIMRSQLDNRSWAPEFYDFKAQYKIVAEIIEKIKPVDIEKKLNEIIRDKKIILTNFSQGSALNCQPVHVQFHDDVCNYLSSIVPKPKIKDAEYANSKNLIHGDAVIYKGNEDEVISLSGTHKGIINIVGLKKYGQVFIGNVTKK